MDGPTELGRLGVENDPGGSWRSGGWYGPDRRCDEGAGIPTVSGLARIAVHLVLAAVSWGVFVLLGYGLWTLF